MRSVILVFLTLCACNTPSPGFYGAEAQSISVDGSRFLVRQKGSLAEVTRTSTEWRPDFAQTAQKAQQAVNQITGCTAAWVEGDVALMIFGLSCNGQKPPPRPKKRRKFDVFCDTLGGGRDSTSFQCEIF